MTVFVRKTSNETNTSTTSVLQDAADLSFALEANKTYAFRFVVFYTTNATTTGARFSVNGPASPTFLRFGAVQAQGTAQNDNGSQTVYDTLIVSATTGPGTTAQWGIVEGIVENGANAGNLVLRFVGENVASATMTLQAESFGFIDEMP